MFKKTSNKKRILIKFGSSSLSNSNGGLSNVKLNAYVKMIANLKNKGHEIIIVSSGAVAAGFKLLGYTNRPSTVEGKQAAAAVGQGLLIQAYNDAFQRYNFTTAQILITRQDFSNRQQYVNAYNALDELLKRGAIPIINENDSIAIEELTFGDNDMLSALVAGLIHADDLIIVTDINGLYNLDPRFNKDACRYNHIEVITLDIENLASNSSSSLGTGGMSSKINAAKTALSFGIPVFIGLANEQFSLENILNGNGDGTYFGSKNLSTLKSKKQWIAFHSETYGKIYIDSGAATALIENGKSLLPAGIKKVEGAFSTNQVVEVYLYKGNLLGKGLVTYSSSELEKVIGYSSVEVKKILNINHSEIIHQDNWITINKIN